VKFKKFYNRKKQGLKLGACTDVETKLQHLAAWQALPGTYGPRPCPAPLVVQHFERSAVVPDEAPAAVPGVVPGGEEQATPGFGRVPVEEARTIVHPRPILVYVEHFL
jgi:hypothetical protein